MMARPWMKRLGRILGYVLLGLLVLPAVAITFTIGWRPFIGPKSRPLTSRKFEHTRERLARGQYLADAVLACFACHSAFDEKSDPPAITSKKGIGRVFLEKGKFRIVASALFPIMGYPHFRHLSEEDLASVVVYLRSLEPVHNSLPKSALPFWLQRAVLGEPQPITTPVPEPDLSSPVPRGEYLVAIAGCGDCHTPEKGMPPRPVADLAFAGGTAFGEVASANITPDPSGDFVLR